MVLKVSALLMFNPFFLVDECHHRSTILRRLHLHVQHQQEQQLVLRNRLRRLSVVRPGVGLRRVQ